VFLLSEASMRSENTMREVNYALGRKGRVIPCLLAPQPPELPVSLRKIACVDFTRSYEEGLLRLVKRLHATR
jgi:TIR domain